MNQLQKDTFEIMKAFDVFCKEHDIQYFLYSGTLLGAVRHQGFIPWDDDADLILDRANFEKMEALLESTDFLKRNGYFYQNRDTSKNYINTFTKIRNPNINIRESLSKSQHDTVGPWIDLFIYDRITEDEDLLKKQYAKLTRYNRWLFIFLVASATKDDKGLKRIVKYVIQKFNEFIRPINPFIGYFIKQRDLVLASCIDPNSKKIGDLSFNFFVDYDDFKRSVLDCSQLESNEQLSFEGVDFPVFRDNDTALRIMYGDYMKIPEEKEQVVHRVRT